MDEGDTARRAFLIDELKNLRTSSESLLFAFDRVFNFGLVFAAAATGLALVNRVTVILVLLPFPIVILFLVLINLNTEGLSRAGQKKWVEEELNVLMGRPVALEESFVAATRKGQVAYIGRFSVFGTQLLLGLLLLALFVVGGLNVVDFGLWWTLAYLIATAFSLFLLVLAAVELARSYDTAYAASKMANQEPGTSEA
jgi:hypothetical protein